MSRAARLTHAARVLRIREMLDARPFLTIAELREEFGVSRRTVYNDLSALGDAGVPIYSEPGPEGEARWMLQTAAKRRTLTMTVGQILSLGLARTVLSYLEGTDLHDELSTVMRRMGQGLSPMYRGYVEQLSRKMAVAHVGPKSYVKKVDVLNDIVTCLLYDELVEIWYRPPGERVRRHLVEPYTLLVHAEALYLIGLSRTRGERRTFAVERISRSTRRRGERFTYPADYTPESVVDGSFGIIGGEPFEVEVLFDADQAHYIKERRWHATQQLKRMKDGRMRLRMRVSGAIEVLRWIVGYSGSAEIVRPRHLRERARELLAAATKRHRDRGR